MNGDPIQELTALFSGSAKIGIGGYERKKWYTPGLHKRLKFGAYMAAETRIGLFIYIGYVLGEGCQGENVLSGLVRGKMAGISVDYQYFCCNRILFFFIFGKGIYDSGNSRPGKLNPCVQSAGKIVC
jgi:hypothetical protein